MDTNRNIEGLKHGDGDTFPDNNVKNSEKVPVINIVLTPNDLENTNEVTGNVPLFIKKLWIIVNDENNEDIISWNTNGDGFQIHDQLQFIAQTLPRYFKHNQLSSFVRQLNLYDFHKIQPLQRDGFQFGHPFFLRDLQQLLPLIKRKTPSGRQKVTSTTTASSENVQQSPEVQDLMTSIKDIKTKSDSISTEMTKLRQENAAIWGEMNSLRVKYSKQTKIINKLIHFLIAYMQKHHNSRKSGRTVSTNNSNKYIKTGPKIMELDYRYKHNPHKFWTDFDNTDDPNQGEQQAYTVVEPTEPNAVENGDQTGRTADSPNMRVSSTIEEILPGSNAFNHMGGSPVDQSLPQFDYTTSHPSSSKAANSALQRSGGNNENVGYLIDNSRVEMGKIKELLKHLTPDDMTNFYKLVNENYKNQEDDLSQQTENELVSLGEMSPLSSSHEYDIHIPDEDIEPFNNIIESQESVDTSISPSALDNMIQEAATSTNASSENVQEPALAPEKIDELSFGMISDDLLNTDEFLHNVSVDQYFNID